MESTIANDSPIRSACRGRWGETSRESAVWIQLKSGCCGCGMNEWVDWRMDTKLERGEGGGGGGWGGRRGIIKINKTTTIRKLWSSSSVCERDLLLICFLLIEAIVWGKFYRIRGDDPATTACRLTSTSRAGHQCDLRSSRSSGFLGLAKRWSWRWFSILAGINYRTTLKVRATREREMEDSIEDRK